MMKRIAQALQHFFSTAGERISSTHPVRQLIAFSLCVGVVSLLWAGSALGSEGKRTVFFFPAEYTGKIRSEIRYLPGEKGQDAKLSLFVRELILGPVTHELAPLFAKETRFESAVVRYGHAYISLSGPTFEGVDTPLPPDQVFEVFKKNVCTNFRNVDKIHMYVNGIEVYSENPFEGANSK